jgi:hypothetical protein
MPRTKRKSPAEEDIESAVADILNSPITRSNLSFLVRPGDEKTGEAANNTIPLSIEPIGVTPVGAILSATGDIKDSESDLAAHSQTIRRETPSTDSGIRSEPTGLTPIGLEPVGTEPAESNPSESILLGQGPETSMAVIESIAEAECADIALSGTPTADATRPESAPTVSMQTAISEADDQAKRRRIHSERARTADTNASILTRLDPVPTGLTPIGSIPVALPPSDALGSETVALEDVLAALGGQRQGRTSRIYRAERVEDGHSATQNTLYWCLWRLGRQVKGSRSRFVQAGYGQLQSALGIDRSNIQDAIRELQKKLSIRILKQSTVGSATVYEVFCCEDILVKRRQEGLLWVRKFGTRRVDFVSEHDIGQEASLFTPIGFTPAGLPPLGTRPSGVNSTVGVSPTPSGGLTPTEGIGVTPIHSVKASISNTERTATAIAQIVSVLRDELGFADDDAAKRIYIESRHNAPDASDDAIIGCIRIEARRLRTNRRVENPIGLLITQVPRRFAGESWRQQSEARLSVTDPIATGDPALEGWRSEQEAALNDPSVPEEEKRLIRICLRQN